MRNVRRARRGLSAAFSIAFALSLTVYAGPAARAFTCQDAIYTSGIAYTGASVVIVASPQRQNGGNLFYFWQKGGTGSWQKEQVASGNDCPNNASGWTARCADRVPVKRDRVDGQLGRHRRLGSARWRHLLLVAAERWYQLEPADSGRGSPRLLFLRLG